MQILEKQKVRPLIDYVPAELKKNRRWYISYHVFNPDTNKLERKMIRVNKVKSLREREKYARKLVLELNLKLHSGWNPFTEQETPKGHFSINQAIEEFLKLKTKELRKDSMRTYKSYLAVFGEWCQTKGLLKARINSLTKFYAIEFLNYVYISRNVGELKYNSYLKFFRSFYNWLIEAGYVKDNVFSGVKPKKANEKIREAIPEEVREKIKNHLERTNYNFLIAAMIVYYSLLRPKELLNIRFQDVDLKRNVIIVPGKVAKNRKQRIATIPEKLKPYIIELFQQSHSDDMYIFSSGLQAGRKLLDSRVFTKLWTKLRQDIDLDSKYQFYSFRDTGIIDLINSGVSLKDVAQHADHSSLEITSIYALRAQKEASEKIRNSSTAF